MDDRYLWDRSGPPDPEVERLERALSPLRHSGAAPAIPDRRRVSPLWAIAAAVAAAAVLGAWLLRPRPGWDVARLEGSPRVGQEQIAESGKLPVGGWLETDASSRAKVRVGGIGQVEVAPNSRVRLLKARVTDHRLALERGSIEARIWAPPRLFFVETPSALAVDLGCVYSLRVDENGGGLLSVTAGWVQLTRPGRDALVPAGANCLMRGGRGPGTPFYDDASPGFRRALEQFDFDPAPGGGLDVVLSQARKRDALTLWHLLLRTENAEQELVFARLSALIPPPPGVTLEAVRERDDRALELWRDELDLPWFQKEVPWWRKAWHRLWT
ncbi:MAG: FecR domain-containing protein [Thermoanaerobaculia bacterium]